MTSRASRCAVMILRLYGNVEGAYVRTMMQADGSRRAAFWRRVARRVIDYSRVRSGYVLPAATYMRGDENDYQS